MDMSNRKEESKTSGFAKTTEFKPILVDTDEQGLKQAEKIADDKLSLFNKAVEWCEKHIVVGDLKGLEEDMITYFEQQLLEQHGHSGFAARCYCHSFPRRDVSEWFHAAWLDS